MLVLGHHFFSMFLLNYVGCKLKAHIFDKLRVDLFFSCGQMLYFLLESTVEGARGVTSIFMFLDSLLDIAGFMRDGL